MKTYLQNVDIECWRHAGRLGTNEPYICFFSSNSASSGPLLLAIDEVAASGPPAKRKITFKECDRPKSISTLRLILSPESDDLRQMHISVDSGEVEIEVTLAGLQQFKDAVTAWRDGAEDFGLSPIWERNRRRELGARDLSSGELWFWGPHYAGP